MALPGAGSAPSKADLRASVLTARRARPPDALATARAAIARLAVDRAGGLACVGAYEPLRTEPGSFELLDGLAAAGTTVLLPVLLPDRDLAWTVRGTGEPASLADAALLFVPALAVDRSGRRLGRGGGSYDRVLGRVGADVPIIALVFDDEVLGEVPVDPWDRPVTGALTPSGWLSFPVVAAPE